VMIVIARPVAVWLCLLPFRVPSREQMYVAWVGLRGSVPIVLATYPWIAGLENAQLFFNVAFFIVLVSLVVQGSTIAPVAKLLGLQVPATSARIHRVDVDLPGQRGFEVVSYRLAHNSRLIGMRPKELTLPELTRIICIARGGRLLSYREWGELQHNDYVSLLTPHTQIKALDRLFESAQEPAGADARRYFGEFVVSADVPLSDLCEAYGLPPPPDAGAATVGEVVRKHLPHPVIGDRLRIGELQLVVRSVDGDRPVEIGLRLPH
jgi:potassium/hydrogen antiporter